MRSTVRAALTPTFIAGIGLDIAGFAGSIVAARLIPLFLSQTIISANLVVTAVIGVAVLGVTLTTRDRVAIVTVVVSLIVLGLTAGERGERTTEAVAQGLIEWVPQSVRLKSAGPFHRSSLGKLAQPSLYAIPREKVGQEWQTGVRPAVAARGTLSVVTQHWKNISSTRRAARDRPVFEHLMAHLRVKRPGSGRARTRPDRVRADKAYSSRAIRTELRRCGITTVIPEPSDQIAHRKRRGPRGGRPPAFDAADYKWRNVIERGFNSVKQWRGLATRYDKLAITYRAAVVLRAITIWTAHLSDTA